MRQNIKVEVVPAPQGWPRVFESHNGAREAGAKFVVWVGPERIYLYSAGDQKPMWSKAFMAEHLVSEPHGYNVGFPDFESAAAWWFYPKPVGGSPAPVPIESCGEECFILYADELWLAKTSGLGCYRAWNMQSFDSAIDFCPTDLVTPFYGTVTITVSPDSTENP